ncbi:unnamed protein product [Brassica napus]|uniref:(rape) hypothetical protein n=1 Tax=Brassica napus TaxID=3708 RepID=A0A816KS50_BRANA|nr:unnamed protein product [Brassica napus]
MELTWDEVLSRGTKHFSEQFSRFCDRKNECHVASMLCWNRAWPEPLLQAFFGASKSVWLVHLLANSLNPGLQIFRVERDDRFYPVYKEETGGDSYFCSFTCWFGALESGIDVPKRNKWTG